MSTGKIDSAAWPSASRHHAKDFALSDAEDAGWWSVFFVPVDINQLEK
ncbi:MAG: hypothetical protein MUO63_08955 [Desulfobulbaceae bacterium]|nr:hypothetical protein [Desulfobulbaceae bacterium]